MINRIKKDYEKNKKKTMEYNNEMRY